MSTGRQTRGWLNVQAPNLGYLARQSGTRMPSHAAMKVTWAWAVGSSVWSLRHDRLGGCGKVQYEAFVLVQPYLSLRAGAAGELARFAIVETAAAVADLDVPGAGPLSGEAGAHRDAQFGGADRGVGISRYRQRACTGRGGGQDAPGHCLIDSCQK